ncbi:HupE/UreJ family protein [bacterium SCSIO 12741]|nr:HupE/UreJ family protein [bacterium SCSIO 12741]
MSTFNVYFGIGVDHILSADGLDHILFILLLGLGYSLHQWKRALGLVTAFTLAHSLTLMLATFQWIQVSAELVEFLIPVTISITALFQLVTSFRSTKTSWSFLTQYALVASFGLLHGMGFSNLLASLLNDSGDLVVSLFAFNVGIEVGQLVIVGAVLLINFLVHRLKWVPMDRWTAILAGGVFLFSLSYYF